MPRPKLSPPTVQPGRLDRDVYTVRELAIILEVHPEVLQKAIRQGEMQANFIGGSAGYRILHDQVLGWLRSRGREPAVTNPTGSQEAVVATRKPASPKPKSKTSSRRGRS